MLNAARNEARELLANSNREATQELREAEAKGNRLLEQSRHQATELTNSARAEVEQTLEWARAQAAAILSRAQTGTEQLLAAAGLGEDEISASARRSSRPRRRRSRQPHAAGTDSTSRPMAPSPVARPSRRRRHPRPRKPGGQALAEDSGKEEAPSEGSAPSDESQDEQQP